MQDKTNIKVGDTLILEGGIDYPRIQQKPREVTVVKIGRRYIYVKQIGGADIELKFTKDTWEWTGDSNWHYKLHRNMTEYENQQTRKRRIAYINQFFRHNGAQSLSDDALHAIMKIIP